MGPQSHPPTRGSPCPAEHILPPGKASMGSCFQNHSFSRKIARFLCWALARACAFHVLFFRERGKQQVNQMVLGMKIRQQLLLRCLSKAASGSVVCKLRVPGLLTNGDPLIIFVPSTRGFGLLFLPDLTYYGIILYFIDKHTNVPLPASAWPKGMVYREPKVGRFEIFIS